MCVCSDLTSEKNTLIKGGEKLLHILIVNLLLPQQCFTLKDENIVHLQKLPEKLNRKQHNS